MTNKLKEQEKLNENLIDDEKDLSNDESIVLFESTNNKKNIDKFSKNDFDNSKQEDLESENIKGNSEYLELLEEIKNKVSEENNDSDNLENTLVMNREELDQAIEKEKEKLNKDETLVTDLKLSENSSNDVSFIANEVAFNDVNANKQLETKENKKTVLEVIGLKKKIGLKTIVEDITFDMREGEIIGLLGPNGSGKTTIMRMLVGLTKISKGDIFCFEKSLGLGDTAMLAEVGSMIESPEFYNYMTGYANLKQLARLSTKKITKEKIKEVLEFVGLEKVARKKVKTYSLGMRQRLGLAQALLINPKILILDEPVNGLDPQGVQDFRNKLKEIASRGVSILVSSHLLDEIEKVSDRIIVLEKGRIIADDNINNLISENVEKTLIATYDNNLAEKLIKDLEINYQLTENGFVFENLQREDKARIISYLVNSYVEIDTVKVVKKSLEERFLEITGKGGTK
ncbi:ABC transporter ATP-binding protein [Gemella sp. GH3]|uniref:ABC transporter ATP-binding protein n=1 Tax=unclassified Gemella TaxID=2624949 RepID=UPI0015D071EA|nr:MULTISPECIES: ABC transporter ATP-binding protein [unclassified Gemella]MBF0713280.1 ABC transporter ATP-binding protein [Gemella sp. GH3.1]NYS50232.1 ABC transporter ATP-binding protein [Gemella sp. GH3]